MTTIGDFPRELSFHFVGTERIVPLRRFWRGWSIYDLYLSPFHEVCGMIFTLEAYRILGPCFKYDRFRYFNISVFKINFEFSAPRQAIMFDCGVLISSTCTPLSSWENF